MRVLRRSVVAAAALAALGGAPVRAGDLPAQTAPAADAEASKKLEAALDALPSPPAPADVAAVIDLVPFGDGDAAAAAVDTLATRGGYAAVRGLRRFLDHPDPFVRAAALRATAALGMRMAEGMAAVRDARTDIDPEVARAAWAAVGAVGDASDVPSLLAAMASEDRALVVTARDALRSMTGLRLPYRVKVWRQWWKETQELEAPRLPQALDLLERSEDPGDVEDARAVIERNAWLDVPATRDRIESWFDSRDDRVRAEAFRMAGKLRYGDLAEPLARALRFERSRAAWDEGVAAAKVLGVRVEGEPPPVAYGVQR